MNFGKSIQAYIHTFGGGWASWFVDIFIRESFVQQLEVRSLYCLVFYYLDFLEYLNF